MAELTLDDKYTPRPAMWWPSRRRPGREVVNGCVGGFDSVKERNVAAWRTESAAALDRLTSSPALIH
jgi:hypothetical protein